MELRHLGYFVAVAQLENVSRAALKLHVSQPALSEQIRDLEDDVGCNLLERTGKSVRLTDAGRVFLSEARAVLQRADEAVRAARAAAGGHETELHVGYLPAATAHFLPGILRAFQKSMPNVQVRLHEQSNEQNLRDLRDRRLQVAFLIRTPHSPPFRKVRFQKIGTMRARLAVAPDHPLARRRYVALAEAAREPFVAFAHGDYSHYYAQLDAVFASVKRKPRVTEEHDSFSSLISSIEAGIGVALVSDAFAYTAGDRVKLLQLRPEAEPAILGIATPESQRSPAAEKFCGCAKEASLKRGGASGKA